MINVLTTAYGTADMQPWPLSRADQREHVAELRDLIVIRRGVSAITEAVTAEQACRRARLLLGQHRLFVDIMAAGETFGTDTVLLSADVVTSPSGRPRIDPVDIAAALSTWCEQHRHAGGAA